MAEVRECDLCIFAYDRFPKSLQNFDSVPGRHPPFRVVSITLLLFLLGVLSSCGPRDMLPGPDAPQQSGSAFALPSSGDLLIHGMVSTLSISELTGQLMMIGMERTGDGEPLLKLSAVERDLIRSLGPGGVVLYASNIDTVDQTRRLVVELQEISALPLLIATDHEGGLVSRLTVSGRVPATEIPPAAVVGAAGDPELAYELGGAIARELRALGIVMNFAPVADIDSTSGRGMMARQLRTYGSEPDAVGEMVAATVRGMQAFGVSAVLKHFPGHGGTIDDSHDGPTTIESSLDHLRAYDLRPFIAGMRAGADAIMTAHVSYPVITGNTLPATLSAVLLTELLREELGFDGLVITDALNMDAVATGMSSGELAIAALHAGVDVLLKPTDAVAVHRTLVAAVHGGVLELERVRSSVRRILEIKLRRGLFSRGGVLVPATTDTIGAREHTAVVEQVKQIAKTRGM